MVRRLLSGGPHNHLAPMEQPDIATLAGGERNLLVLSLDLIRRDGNTQSRVSVDQSVVREYAEKMKTGVEFPPVRTWFDGTNYWLSDGFQRVAAAELVGLVELKSEVHFGRLQDAQWDSYSANMAHGLRRSRSDIKAIIQNALAHPIGRQLSNSQIARHVGVPE